MFRGTYILTQVFQKQEKGASECLRVKSPTRFQLRSFDPRVVSSSPMLRSMLDVEPIKKKKQEKYLLQKSENSNYSSRQSIVTQKTIQQPFMVLILIDFG